MSVVDDVVRVLATTLQLDESVVATLTESSPLLGAMPEFDSIAVATVMAALEEQFGIAVEDDELSADIFESIGSLAQFVEGKLTILR